jgi:hypothetical protein
MDVLTLGATLFVTNESPYPQTSGRRVQVVNANLPVDSQGIHCRRS